MARRNESDAERKARRAAEYQARKARAQAEGWKGYGQRRRAREQGVADAARYRELAEQRKRTARQIHQLPDGKKLVTTTRAGKGWGVIQAQLRKAGDRLVTATVLLDDGRRRTLWSNGYRGRRALQALHEAGGGLEAVAELLNGAGHYGADEIDATDIASVQIEIK